MLKIGFKKTKSPFADKQKGFLGKLFFNQLLILNTMHSRFQYPEL